MNNLKYKYRLPWATLSKDFHRFIWGSFHHMNKSWMYACLYQSTIHENIYMDLHKMLTMGGEMQ